MKGFGRKSISTRNFPKRHTLVPPGVYLFIIQRDMGCRSAATLVFLLQFCLHKKYFRLREF